MFCLCSLRVISRCTFTRSVSQFRSFQCMVSACVGKLVLKFLTKFQSSTNATARFVEVRGGLLQIRPQSWPPRISNGFAALRSFVLGLRTRGSVQIFVQTAALQCPIKSGICPISGFLQACLKQRHRWKFAHICLLRLKLHGTSFPRLESNMKPCRSYQYC